MYAEMPENGEVDVSAADHPYTMNAMNRDLVASTQYRLTLNADTALTVKVKLKAEPTDTVVMKVNGSAVTPAVSGRTYRVAIGSIAANNLAVLYAYWQAAYVYAEGN